MPRSLQARSVDAVHQRPFVIVLKGGQFVAETLGRFAALALEIDQGRSAVNTGLTQSQQIQIRTIDDQ